jgi:uncharacterized protein
LNAEEKYAQLLGLIRELSAVAIGYSGGVDSTFLLAAACAAIGDRAVGVIGRSPTYPQGEMEEALRIADGIGARVIVVDTDELSDPAFFNNPPTRCFACKSTLFKEVWKVAREQGCTCVMEGSNADDISDFRPGMDAARGLQVRAPLLELGFTKEDIRAVSRRLGLPTWNKPAMACLSSRIPWGQKITPARLRRIETAEGSLKKLGFVQLRVRDYDDLCRIEVAPEAVARFARDELREQVVAAMKDAGYRYVCVDLEGFRSGSMNAVLTEEARRDARSTKEEP